MRSRIPFVERGGCGIAGAIYLQNGPETVSVKQQGLGGHQHWELRDFTLPN